VWRRAALAAALFFVSMIAVLVITSVLGFNLIAQFKSRQIVSVTEARESPLTEAILVADLAPDIEPPIVSCGPFSIAKQHLSRNTFSAFDSENLLGNDVVADEFGFRNWKSASPFLSAEVSTNDPRDFSCRQISRILDADVAGKTVARNKQFNAKRLDAKIGSLKNAAFVDLSLGDPSQNPSGYEQQERKARNGIILRFLKILDENPRYVIWTTCLIGLSCAAIGFAVYLYRDSIISRLGFTLFVLGLICPIFPWWVLLFWPLVGE
jgi:hypothetical protein